MHPDFDFVLPTANRPDLVMARGQGDFLFDTDGRRYLDFVQGWAVNALGHSSSVVADALYAQARTLVHASAGFYNVPQLALSRALAEASGLGHVFVCTTGAEANEAAIKLARKWGAVHRGGAHGIVSTTGAFHGRTLATMSASGKPEFAPLFEPKVTGFRKVAFGDAAAVEDAIDESTVAVMIEPIQGEAGVVVPPAGYLRALREITTRRGVLLVLDEVQTGIGRTGPLFAFEHEGIRPDVLTLGKGLGAGMPAAAMLCTPEVSCFSPGDHGGTHAGHPLVCSVALAVLATVSEPSFLRGIAERSAALVAGLERIAAMLPGGQVRGRGLLIALDLGEPIAVRVVEESRRRGLLLNAPRPSLLRFMPALNVELDSIASMLTMLEAVIADVRAA